MPALKWALLILFGLVVFGNIVNISKHGQPREPHSARDNAISAIIYVVFFMWVWFTL